MALSKLRLGQLKPADGSTTVGDVHFPNVIFLAKFDGSNGSTSITDSSNKNHTITVNGGAQISTAASKFGGSSLKLDYENAGTGDRIVADTVADNLTSTTHTIEFWFKTDMADGHITSQNPCFFGFNDAGASYANRLCMFMLAKTTIRVATGSGNVDLTVSAMNDNEWHHITLVSDGTDYDLYLDGSRGSTDMGDSVQINSDDTFIIGAELDSGPSTGNYFSGYIDDFRITNAVARYTGASFTLPTTHLTSAGDVNKHIVVNSGADGVVIGTGGISQARIAKAWAEFDGSGLTLNASYNVSSVTDHGNRDYTINFGTAMADTNYSIVGSNIGQTASYNWSVVTGMGTAKTTSAARINVPHINDSSLYGNDPDAVNVIAFGN